MDTLTDPGDDHANLLAIEVLEGQTREPANNR